MIFRVPVDRFEDGSLSYNDLLAAALCEQDADAAYEITDWQASMREFESVRYDATICLAAEDILAPTPMPRP